MCPKLHILSLSLLFALLTSLYLQCLNFQLTTQLLLQGPSLNIEPEVQGLSKAQLVRNNNEFAGQNSKEILETDFNITGLSLTAAVFPGC